jgi:hypothetical protein
MRLVIGLITLIGSGAIMALADAPSATPSSTPAQASASTAAPPAATDPREKMLKLKGYRLEVHNGERTFCRREEVLGSRLGGRKVCGTVEQLEDREHLSREIIEKAQQMQANPVGK